MSMSTHRRIPKKLLPYFDYSTVPDRLFSIAVIGFFCGINNVKIVLQLIEKLHFTSALEYNENGEKSMNRKDFIRFHHQLYELCQASAKLRKMLQQYS